MNRLANLERFNNLIHCQLPRIMYCLGCGIDIPDSEDVAMMWRWLLEEDYQSSIDSQDIDTILSGADGLRAPKMCRKCFYAYEKLVEAQNSIRDNLRKAAEALDLCSQFATSLPKRSRLARPLFQPAHVQSSEPTTSLTPQKLWYVCMYVYVYYYTIITLTNHFYSTYRSMLVT